MAGDIGLYLLMLSLVQCTDAVCGRGWFGDRCQYRCRCDSNRCQSDGFCEGGVRCQAPFFGYQCQYVDLAHRAIQSHSCGAIHDHNDTTCVEGQDGCLLIFRHSHPILFVRVVVKYKGERDTVTLRYIPQGHNVSQPCDRSARHALNDFTVDIYCQSSLFKIHTVEFGGTKSLCSVYVTPGRLFSPRLKTESSEVVNGLTPNKTVDGDYTVASCFQTLPSEKSDNYFQIDLGGNVISILALFYTKPGETIAMGRASFKHLDATSNNKKTVGLEAMPATDAGYGDLTLSYMSQLESGVNFSSLRLEPGEEGSGRYELSFCEVEIFGACVVSHYGPGCKLKCDECGDDGCADDGACFTCQQRGNHRFCEKLKTIPVPPSLQSATNHTHQTNPTPPHSQSPTRHTPPHWQSSTRHTPPHWQPPTRHTPPHWHSPTNPTPLRPDPPTNIAPPTSPPQLPPRPNNCQAGAIDPTTHRCVLGCNVKFWSEDCSKDCGHCAGVGACHQKDGRCEAGCLLGYEGDGCRKAIAKLRGKNKLLRDKQRRRRQANHCAGGAVNPATGACTGGCVAGFSGANCNEACIHCGGNGACHQTTHICTESCVPGYHGEHCADACVNCGGNGACNRDTAACLNGCSSNFQGTRCLDPKKPWYKNIYYIIAGLLVLMVILLLILYFCCRKAVYVKREITDIPDDDKKTSAENGSAEKIKPNSSGKEEPGMEEPEKKEPAKEEPAKEEPAKEEPAKEEKEKEGKEKKRKEKEGKEKDVEKEPKTKPIKPENKPEKREKTKAAKPEKRKLSDDASVKSYKPPAKEKDKDTASVSSSVDKSEPAGSHVSSEAAPAPAKPPRKAKPQPVKPKKRATFKDVPPSPPKEEDVVVAIPILKPSAPREVKSQGIGVRIRKMSERFWIQKEWGETQDGRSYMKEKEKYDFDD